MKSIQSKILLVVIAGLLVITAVVSSIAVTMMHEVIHKDADRILQNVCQKEAAKINDVLGDVEKSAAIMEHYAMMSLGRVEDLHDEAKRDTYIENAKTMFREIALNTQSIDGFFFRLAPEVSTGLSGFFYMPDAEGGLVSMPITDLSNKTASDAAVWYHAPIQAGGALWLDPYVHSGHQGQIISYVIPLYIQGKLIGVLGFNMDFDSLKERIASVDVYEHGYALLLSHDRATVYTENDRADVEETESHLYTKAASALLNGMHLELRADYQDIQKDIRPMMTRIVLAFLVVLAGSIVYTVFVTHRIVKPLKQLTAAADNFAAGSVEAERLVVPVDSKDEIGTLSRVLVSAYEKIREYTAYINVLAYKDSLTGVKNTTAYREAVEELEREILRGNPTFGVLVADINNLKATNDRYGHDVGNELIIHTAKILSETFKHSPVFRIGGDEFVILLRDRDYEHYPKLIEQMDEEFAKDFVTALDHTIPVSVARGIAVFDPRVDSVYKDVFGKADHAMYMHKEEHKCAARV